jgi:HlyD family secretion protein
MLARAQSSLRCRSVAQVAGWASLVSLVGALSGCGANPQTEANAQTQPREQIAAVNVAISRTAAIAPDLQYTGTTQPYRQVAVRSQVEGQLVDLAVDVGDPVSQGQTLGRLDDQVLTATVVEAEAEVAAREAEVAQARTEVSNAQTQVEDARLRLQQAASDLARYEQLFRSGAIAEQQVDSFRTAVGTARQALKSAQENVKTRQQAVAAVQRRVVAQRAIVARERERQSYSVLTSPVSGVVLSRTLEPGNLAQPGSEIVQLGDFSQVKIAVQVSELELGSIRPGQAVTVRLDAFPGQSFAGRVSRVSPAADPTARLLPVEVTIPNSGNRIGSGLLARVQFNQQRVQRVVIPETALSVNQERRSRAGGGANSNGQRPQGDRPNPTRGGGATAANPAQANRRPSGQAGSGPGEAGASNRPSQAAEPKAGTVFVVQEQGPQATAIARSVALGQRQDGQVEVLSGLQPGERLITRSSKAIQDGDRVQLSILSDQ